MAHVLVALETVGFSVNVDKLVQILARMMHGQIMLLTPDIKRESPIKHVAARHAHAAPRTHRAPRPVPAPAARHNTAVGPDGTASLPFNMPRPDTARNVHWRLFTPILDCQYLRAEPILPAAMRLCKLANSTARPLFIIPPEVLESPAHAL